MYGCKICKSVTSRLLILVVDSQEENNQYRGGKMNEWMDGWKDGWMNGCMNACMDEWMNEWVNEWMNYSMNESHYEWQVL